MNGPRRLLAAPARVTRPAGGNGGARPIMTLYMARDYVPLGPDIDYVDDGASARTSDMLIEPVIPGIR